MASRVRLDWNGDAIISRVTEAVREAIDETTQETDYLATRTHPWRNRTGLLERKIKTAPAHVEGDRVVGSVGVSVPPGAGRKGVRNNPFYGLFKEYQLPWLRPAADIVFPTLARRIRRRLER